MKHFISTFVLGILYSQISIGQSSNQNFIKKTFPVSPVSTEAALNSLGANLKVESINYFDGLGRPLQDVLVKGSPASNDVIQPYVYDQYGRQAMKFLPYTDTTSPGSYRSAFVTALSDFYVNQTKVGKTAFPYSEAVFDNSPMNKVTETSAPDADWQLGNDHTSLIESSYNADPNEDMVMLWELQGNGDYTSYDYYPQSTLYTSKHTDPNGNYSIVYTDKTGKAVCMKQFLEIRYNNGNPYPYYLITYMVYDDFGQLVLVIPPKAMELMDASQNYSINSLAEDLVYRYKYDQRHRLIEKKVPGIGWHYIVYNQLDQPVLFRDANLIAQNKWGFIKYDMQGRAIISGLMNSLGLTNYQSRTLAQAQFDLNQLAMDEVRGYDAIYAMTGYTNLSLPTQNLEILTINYYDDYDFNNNGVADHTFNTASIPCIPYTITAMTNNYNYQLDVEGNAGKINAQLNSALSLASNPSTIYTLISQAKALNVSLGALIYNNMNYSEDLLNSQDPALLNTLQTSLTGTTATTISQLKKKLADCLTAIGLSNLTLRAHISSANGFLQTLITSNNLSINTLSSVQNMCTPYVNTVSNRIRGYLTGSKVKVLDAANPVQWQSSAIFYDNDGQAIQSQSNDHMGGTDLINMVYDFAGNVIHSQQVHSFPGQADIQVLNHMSFDKVGRLLRVDQKNNNDHPVILSTYNYNELSQLVDKKVHAISESNSFLQSMDFRYNIHGWLTSINNIDLSNDMGINPLNGTNDDVNDLWGMELSYNQPSITGTPQYNGNISEKKWRSVDYSKRSYTYAYDKLDRLKSSSYAEFSGVTGWNVNLGKYDEKDISYDANGNIKSLKRYGFQPATSTFGLIDNLAYQYNGNFLGSVTDASSAHGMADFKDNGSTGSNEYTYDNNGNMTINPNKGITGIVYNHLNLPVQINFNTGNKIEYTYDAVGTRLRKKITQGSIVTIKNYSGAFEYNSNNLLESMHSAEGRCVTTGTQPEFRYEYQYVDNTGNVMMAFSDLDFDNIINPATEVLQQNHYYSFGMRMEGTNAPFIGVENKYKFSGKELDDELGLNEYDFGARMYDPAIARWSCIDPMAYLAPHWTPFRYGFNNPVLVTDPSGMYEESGVSGGDDDPKKKAIDGAVDVRSFIIKGAEQFNTTPMRAPVMMQSITVKQIDFGTREVPAIVTQGIVIVPDAPKSKEQGDQLSQMDPTFWDNVSNEVDKAAEMGRHEGKILYGMLDDLYLSYNWIVNKENKNLRGYQVGFEETVRTSGLTIVTSAVGVLGKWISALKYGCFVKETLIWTEKGMQNIEDVKEGDVVYAYNVETKAVVLKKVLTSYVRDVDQLIKLEYENEVVFTTSEHPFYVNNAWIEASKLKTGDLLFLHDQTTVPLLRVTKIDTLVKVYNFTVEDEHNYFVGSKRVLVHNNNPCSQPLKNISGSLTDAANAARTQQYGANTNIWRRLPITAQDMQALTEAQAGMGRNTNIILKDPRYLGWEKWHHSAGLKGSKSVVHYLRNPTTGQLTDFKFK